jgi:hypoxanthine phosphoribosyltransferase
MSALEVRRIDWPEYGRLCKLIAERVAAEFKPEEIVGIAGGGTVVGATVASLLKIDFFPIKISMKVSEQVVRKHVKITVPPTAHLEKKKVLLIDDRSVTGHSIREAAREISKLNPSEVASAVLVRGGEFQPDYYAIFSFGEVIFPWEEEASAPPFKPQETIDK